MSRLVLFILLVVIGVAGGEVRLNAQTTTSVSLTPGGTPATVTGVERIAISVDGRFVAFYTLAANLVPDDTNGTEDVFVHDRQSGLTTRVSVSTAGTQANGPSSQLAMSGDGRHVVFQSAASNLVAGDTNSASDVFVHDRQTGSTARVSVSSSGGSGTGDSAFPAISADGRFVAFASTAPNLVAGDTNASSDIFVRDLFADQTSRVSISSGGAQANGPNGSVSLSGDGRLVLFETGADNLVAGDTNGIADVVLHDRSTGVTTRVIEGTYRGQQILSGNGRYVVFASASPDLVPGDTNGFHDIYLLDLHVGTTTRINVTAGGSEAIGGYSDSPSISTDGRFVAFLSAAGNLVPGDTSGSVDVFVHDRAIGATIRASVNSDGADGSYGVTHAPVISGGGGAVAFVSTTSGLVPTDSSSDPNVFVHDLDADADGLLLPWETAFGLDPRSGSGANGADGDPDGDGHTNAQEQAERTHPRGFHTRYLAEGASSIFFDTRLAILNATGINRVHLRFQKGDGTIATRVLPMNGLSRTTFDPAVLPEMDAAEFSTIVEAELPVVVDRRMQWDATGYGAHAETSLGAPSTIWYLAEGATHSNFSLFYLVLNPHASSVPVTVTYLLPAPAAPLTKVYTVPAQSRFNIWVNNEGAVDAALAVLASTDVSAVITAPQPILVERAMYLTQAGADGAFGTPDDIVFGAGHESAGVTAPALSWFLAEGATGPYFDEFLLIANPTPTAAEVEVRYLLGDGTVLTKTYVVAAKSRFNIWVNEEDFPGLGKALADAAVSATLTSTNAVPVIVERAMWWPRPAATWMEAHNSAGTTATGTVWALAEGEDAGPQSTQTYILVANTSPFAGTARVTLVVEGGGTMVLDVALPANSRTNVPVDAYSFPGVTGQRFGAIVESLGGTPAQIVVERAMYSDANGIHWAAGTNATATRLEP